MPTWLSDCTGICEGWYCKEKKLVEGLYPDRPGYMSP